MNLYSAKGVCEASGATYRQVHYWTEQGWLVPLSIAGEETHGSGHRRTYGGEAVATARALVHLLGPRLSGDLAAAVAVALRGERADLGGGWSLHYSPPNDAL